MVTDDEKEKERQTKQLRTQEEEHEDEDDGAEEGKGEEEQLADITNNIKNKKSDNKTRDGEYNTDEMKSQGKTEVTRP